MGTECPHPEIEPLLGPGDWWFRCTAPERPGDEWTTYKWTCDGCFLGLVADVNHEPDARSTEHDDDGNVTIAAGRLADTLQRAIEHRRSGGLPTFERIGG